MMLVRNTPTVLDCVPVRVSDISLRVQFQTSSVVVYSILLPDLKFLHILMQSGKDGLALQYAMSI